MQGPYIFLFIVGMIVLVLGVVCLFKPLVNLRMANRKWAGAWIFGGFVVMMAAAVNAPPTPPKSEEKVVAEKGDDTEELVKPEPVPEPSPPEPMYASIDGDEYLYSAGISEDARDAGQVAGEFIPFRYRGVKGGKITLTSKGMTLRCDEDCRVITVTTQYGSKEHIEYTPSSVAGAAFSDAMNGLLVERPSQKAKEASK